MNPLVPLREFLLLAPLVIAAAALLAALSARRVPRPLARSVTALRALGIALLLLLALNPGRWHRRGDAGRVRRAVLLDRSASMAERDADGAARWDAARGAVERLAAAGPGAWDLYTFAEGLEPAPDARALADRAPDGGTTALARALDRLLDRHRGDTLEAVVVLSDGRDTAGGDADGAALRYRARDCPIHVVPLGGPVQPPDLAVRLPLRRLVAFAGQPVTLRARVAARGLGPVRAVAQVFDAGGRPVARATADLDGDAEAAVALEWPAGESGYLDYTLRVEPAPGEENRANNEAAFGVSALDRPIRALLAEGTPTWDSKFLAQLLRRQPNVALTALYRLSGQRYLRVERDEPEREVDGAAAFPRSAAEMAAYDVLLLGKGCEHFFDAPRLEALRAFLRDRGGAVVFYHGKPYAGAHPGLQAFEPVEWRAAIETPFRFVPRAGAAAQGLFGELLPAADDPLWARLPPLAQAHRAEVGGAFAQVLAEGRAGEGGETFPLLVARRIGLGRVLAVNAQDFWKWHFFPEQAEAAQAYEALWTQLVYWAALSSEFLPGSDWSLRLGAGTATVGDRVPVRIRGRDAVAGRAPRLDLYREGRRLTSVEPAPVPESPDTLAAALSFDTPGLYRIALVEEDRPGARPAEALLHVRPAPAEGDDRSSDRAALVRLAERSGGRVLAPGDLAALRAELDGRAAAAEAGAAYWRTRWDRGWILLALIAPFAMEWFLRRRHGLL